jgi:beta-lactam-binding protein with PASTA domain
MSTRERPPGPAAPTELIGSPVPPPAARPPGQDLWPWLLVLLVLVIAGLTAVWYATKEKGSAAGPVTVQTTVAAKPKAKLIKHTTTAATTTQVQTVVVPNLVGQSRDAAVSTIQAQGLIADVHEVPSTQADGTVVSQHPAGGSKVDSQSGVLINVANKVEPKPAAPAETPPAAPKPSKPASHETATPKPATPVVTPAPKAPANVTVPSVVGEDEGTASADLVDAGFSTATVDQATTDPTQDGVVVSQSPSGGGSAQPNSTVTIYVARYNGTGDFATG